MGEFEKISVELHQYFSRHAIFKILLDLDQVILFGCVGVLALSQFISVGSLLNVIAYYGFLLGLLLVFSKQNQQALYTGLFIYAASEGYQVVWNALFSSYHYLDFNSLITFLIFGYLGFSVYQKSTKYTVSQ